MSGVFHGATRPRFLSFLVGLFAAIGLLFGASVAAADPPTPTSGPAGTAVTGDAPEFSFTQVAAGMSHSLAIGSDGAVYSWGSNYEGELGNNSTTASNTPVAVAQGAIPADVTIEAISAGRYVSLALGSDGKVYGWGANTTGQLGNETGIDSSVPVAVSQGDIPDGVSIEAISAGSDYSLALGSDGKVYGWGFNGDGQLGTGSTWPSGKPIAAAQGAIPADVTIETISAGQGGFSLAIGSDGQAYSWGFNLQGQLGNGTTTNSSLPVAVSAGDIPAGVSLEDAAAGSSHSVVVGSDDKLYSWGVNPNGELGNGTTTNSNVPVAVSQGAIPAGVSIVDVTTGVRHSSVLGSDDKVYGWGQNNLGQLGDGTTTNRSVPVALTQGAIPAEVTIEHLSAGSNHSLVLGSDGKAYSWGHNYSGELGNGNTGTGSTIPVAVTEPEIVLTGVLFGSTPGEDFSATGTEWTATSPAGETGTVDVTLQYTVNGTPKTIVFEDGYTYTVVVSFDTQGGSEVAPQTTTSGEPVAEPEAPTRDGYAFTGWYTDAEATTAYDFTSPVNENLTLYAGWEQTPPAPAGKFTVSFDSQGGSEIPQQTVTSGETVTKPESAPTRDGYTFTGWYTDSEAKTAYDFATPVTADLTLYAGWAQQPASQSADDSGLADTGATSSSAYLAIGSALLLTIGAGVYLMGRRRHS